MILSVFGGVEPEAAMRPLFLAAAARDGGFDA